jgi:hypothetical protein
MFIIEYVVTASALIEKHGALGYRILDRNQQCVASQDA